jgi:hypothetical protein
MVGPATSGELQLTDPSGAALPGARVALQGDMSHAGMQPLLAAAAETTAGVYQVAVDVVHGRRLVRDRDG